MERPGPATVARDGKPHDGTGGRRLLPIRERQRAHETVEAPGGQQLARHDSRPAGREADLLLMVPALRELARGVKPVRRCFFTGPRDAKRGDAGWIQRLKVRGELRGALVHQGDQRGRIERPIPGHALGIDPIDEGRQLRGRSDRRGS